MEAAAVESGGNPLDYHSCTHRLKKTSPGKKRRVMSKSALKLKAYQQPNILCVHKNRFFSRKKFKPKKFELTHFQKKIIIRRLCSFDFTTLNNFTKKTWIKGVRVCYKKDLPFSAALVSNKKKLYLSTSHCNTSTWPSIHHD